MAADLKGGGDGSPSLIRTHHGAATQRRQPVKSIHHRLNPSHSPRLPLSLIFLTCPPSPAHLFHFCHICTQHICARAHAPTMRRSLTLPNAPTAAPPPPLFSVVLMHWGGLCAQAMRRAVPPLRRAVRRWPVSAQLTVLNISSFT